MTDRSNLGRMAQDFETPQGKADSRDSDGSDALGGFALIVGIAVMVVTVIVYVVNAACVSC